MDLDKVWVDDPSNKNKPSVSLTLLILSVIFVIITGTMQVLDIVKNTGPFLEMMYSFVALYFGRRFTFNDKKFSSEKAEKVQKDVENASQE